jgi:hypothetical protein
MTSAITAWAVMDQKVSWEEVFALVENGAYRRILDPVTLVTSNSYFDVKTLVG